MDSNVKVGSIIKGRIIAKGLLNPTPAELEHGVDIRLVVDEILHEPAPPNNPLVVMDEDSVRLHEEEGDAVIDFAVTGAVRVWLTDESGQTLFDTFSNTPEAQSLLFGREHQDATLVRAAWEHLAKNKVPFQTQEVVTFRDRLANFGHRVVRRNRQTDAAVAYLLAAGARQSSADFAMGYLLGPAKFHKLLDGNKIASTRLIARADDVTRVIHTLATWKAKAIPEIPYSLAELAPKTVWLVAHYLLHHAKTDEDLISACKGLLELVADYAKPVSGANPEYFWHGRLRGLIFGTFVAGLYATVSTASGKDKARAKILVTSLDSVLSAVSAGIGLPGAAIEFVKPWILVAAEHYMEKRHEEIADVAKRTEAQILETTQRAKAYAISEQQRTGNASPIKYDVASAIDWFMIALKHGGY